jgi:hypothetical protein
MVKLLEATSMGPIRSDWYDKGLEIDERVYSVRVIHHVSRTEEAPRLIVAAYQPNKWSQEVLRVCIESVQRSTTEPYELWVVDNNSPWDNVKWLTEWPGINVVLNRNEPIPPNHRGLWQQLRPNHSQQKWGSYANAVALELGVRVINQETKWVFTMHSDCLALLPTWFDFLRSHTSDSVRAVGCWADNARIRALHVGALLFDLQLFRELECNFLPNLGQSQREDYPEYDAGDLITIRFKEKGYKVHCCENTYNSPELVNRIPTNHPLRFIHADRCFDEKWNVIFAHMGRGISKSEGSYKTPGKTYPQQWVAFARDWLES